MDERYASMLTNESHINTITLPARGPALDVNNRTSRVFSIRGRPRGKHYGFTGFNHFTTRGISPTNWSQSGAARADESLAESKSVETSTHGFNSVAYK